MMPALRTPELAFERALQGRRVLVTGHTGFTGSWLCLWLQTLGARVAGLALPPETEPSLYSALGLADIDSTIGDIGDATLVSRTLERVAPEVIFHLAAQPLVRRSYRTPVDTFMTNVMGTAHVLDAARQTPSVRAVVCVTTDKVYANREWEWPYRENDALGGKDPYSASKAAAEMVIDAYRTMNGAAHGTGPAIATARGGNIIGGGDWSEDRLVPDFVRAVVHGGELTLRYPEATRPWQHVLALAHAYLVLAHALLDRPEAASRSWNFGPSGNRSVSVRELVETLAAIWKRPAVHYLDAPLPESRALALDSSLARDRLDWWPAWNTHTVVERTAEWYRRFYEGESARGLCLEQLEQWRSDLATSIRA